MSKKKFFSGNSVRQALLAAASHFELPPEQIAYREVEKKHGFLKAKKRAVIEVDAENPQRPLTTAEPSPESAAPAERQEPAPETERGRGRSPRTARGAAEEASDGGEAAAEEMGEPSAPEESLPSPTRRGRPARRAEAESPEPVSADVETGPGEEADGDGDDDGDDRPRHDDDWDDDDDRDDDSDDDEDEDEDEDDDRDDDDDDDDQDDDFDDDDQDDEDEDEDEEPREAPVRAPGGGRRQPADAVTPAPPVASDGDGGEPVRRRRRRRRGGRGRGGATSETAGGSAQADSQDDLVALPEHPRRPAERYAEARGPLADAARQALDKVLGVAGLELSYTVLQGEDRLEIELAGRDEALLVAEGGELLRAVEHLVPRVVRSLTGEPVSVRVDSSDFHEIHEEQLRSLAQRVASEVRRSERPRTLEPMSPADRRIVHITLADEPRVTSMSEGSGYFKRIVVKLS